MRHGPWLPTITEAPASYVGPLVYGSGLILVARYRWGAHR